METQKFASDVQEEVGVTGSRPRAQRVDDLALGGETPFLFPGEDLLVAGGHHEDAAASADELTVESELFLDFSRQTGGSREVVSNAAVVDPDMHDLKPP
jgi:hypothetical protein